MVKGSSKSDNRKRSYKDLKFPESGPTFLRKSVVEVDLDATALLRVIDRLEHTVIINLYHCKFFVFRIADPLSITLISGKSVRPPHARKSPPRW